ncbi:MAG: hypothetical protein ACFB2Z_02500 [Maricaulaceae bacterium]
MNARDLVFANFNLHGFQDAGLPGLGGTPVSASAFREKAVWVGDAINRLDADIVAFQDLWSPNALRAAFEAGNLADDYQLVFIPDRLWRGPAVAAAVRRTWRVRDHRVHTALPEAVSFGSAPGALAAAPLKTAGPDPGWAVTAFSHPVLELTLDFVDDTAVPPLSVLCLDLAHRPVHGEIGGDALSADDGVCAEAFARARAAARRAAEAAAVRAMFPADRGARANPVVVLGGFNDHASSDTLGIVQGRPSYRLAAKDRAGRFCADGIYNAAHLQAAGCGGYPLFIHCFSDVPVLFDHILVSDAFVDASVRRFWSLHSFHILTDHLCPHQRHGPASDHGLVQAVFDWNPVID